MLHDFLIQNRSELIARCAARAAHRTSRVVTEDQVRHGIPLFLDQLVVTLGADKSARLEKVEAAAGPTDAKAEFSAFGVSASIHGSELLKLGFSVDQVVHSYGDLCQSVTDLAFERNEPVSVDEFRTLNRCLDNAIADSVMEFGRQKNEGIEQRIEGEMDQRLGFLAHELRNLLNSATLAFSAAKLGSLPLSGATGSVLERSLVGLASLINRTLAEVRMRGREPLTTSVFSLAEFIADSEAAAVLEASARGCHLVVAPVDPELAVIANRDLLSSALGNLLQNAFKFTQPATEIRLVARAIGGRILIEVFDHCGGLPAGDHEPMFLPFVQRNENRNGLGLGLSITRHSVENSEGTLTVRDVPGEGCVFTISLPAYLLNGRGEKTGL